MAAENYLFWRERLAAQMGRFDLLRIDHFRGLAAYWAVPAGAATAREGHWREAPGQQMLTAVRREMPDLPLVAEDLGVITPDVDALRREFGLPGMRVLQFAFGGDAGNPHLPHNHSRDVVVYTGTHDNDTTAGWAAQLTEPSRSHVQDYLSIWDQDMPEAMTRAALASVAGLAILPLQDVLHLGSEARLNTPGTVLGNWQWRAPLAALTPRLAHQCRELNALFGRC
jgi:4-alpha-glucanotransferase